MKCSANEVMTLAAKAARGAGAPPAQAADFGAAALRHLQAGREVDMLIDALKALPSGPVIALPLVLMQILENSTDGIAEGGLEPGSNATLIQSYLDAQPFETQLENQAGSFHITLFPTKLKAAPLMPRVDAPDDLLASFQSYAARILVPESDASRLSGAGAGLTDND